MHGIIFTQLNKYVDKNLGSEAWNQILEGADLDGKTYLPIRVYPDNEMYALVASASAITGSPASEILESFGQFLVPNLIDLYSFLIKPEWETLDVIEHAQEMIHRVISLRDPKLSPPVLKCNRQSPQELVVTYDSTRKICGVAKGIINGLAKCYRQKVVVTEPQCMQNGHSACRIVVKLVQ